MPAALVGVPLTTATSLLEQLAHTPPQKAALAASPLALAAAMAAGGLGRMSCRRCVGPGARGQGEGGKGECGEVVGQMGQGTRGGSSTARRAGRCGCRAAPMRDELMCACLQYACRGQRAGRCCTCARLTPQGRTNRYQSTWAGPRHVQPHPELPRPDPPHSTPAHPIHPASPPPCLSAPPRPPPYAPA